MPRRGEPGRGSNAPPLADLEKLLGVDEPASAMAHLPPLPGTPLYDDTGGPDAIVASVDRDVEILTAAGFDAVMFCSEGDRPYGVDYLWGAKCSARGRRGDGHVFHPRGADRRVRVGHGLGADHVAVFMNIAPEFASSPTA